MQRTQRRAERNSFDPDSCLFHILSLEAECDRESRWCSGVGAQPQIIQLKGGSNLIVHANWKTGQSSCPGVSWEAWRPLPSTHCNTLLHPLRLFCNTPAAAAGGVVSFPRALIAFRCFRSLAININDFHFSVYMGLWMHVYVFTQKSLVYEFCFFSPLFQLCIVCLM